MGKLDIFDRSNTTIQTDTSRASEHYRAGYPFQYHVDEISNPRFYSTYFNVGYKGILFGVINSVLTGLVYDPSKYKEQLQYGTDKTGEDEYTVMKACDLDKYALKDANDEPMTDANGYIIII